MTKFSPSEAALEGFRLTREEPRAFAYWAGFCLAVSVLNVLVWVSLPQEVRTALETLTADRTLSARELLDTLIAVGPVLAFGLTIQCMMAAAVYRIIFRHDDPRFGYLRLGADEFRLMGLTLIYVGLMILAVTILSILAALVAVIFSFVWKAATLQIAVLLQFVVLGVLAYGGVRLSLAPVATFAERRIRVFSSWKLTHGVFWRLLGAYVLAAACMMMIFMLVMVIFAGVYGAITVAGGGELADIRRVFVSDDAQLSSYLTPGKIAYSVVGSVMSALWYAVIASPGAVAYRELHGAPEG